jgi:hypothetical protein
MNRPVIKQSIEVPYGRNRLVLLQVPLEGWPPDSAFDFHSIRWEVKTGVGWETKIELGYPELEKVLGDQASVSRLHSFNSESGRAVIQFSTKGPTDSYGSEWCLYTWREWDLLKNREHRFIEISEDIFGPPKDEFAIKCEAEAETRRKRIADQGGGAK